MVCSIALEVVGYCSLYTCYGGVAEARARLVVIKSAKIISTNQKKKEKSI